ncbi:MAG TPA: hypothetical protein VNA12_05275 [Mycobacteriales bacterium]|nr:hypothetical protein [Mycobacteriales bacterium]
MTAHRIQSAVLLAVLASVAAGSVGWAGGATIEFAEPSYQVGDVAYGASAVAYRHNPDLGAPEEGPYYLYLAPATPPSPNRPWPFVPPGAIRVATVQFRKGPVQEPGTTFLSGPDHVVVEFTVPTLAPGDYDTIVCDDPCESSLGDLVDGRFVVAPGQRSPNALPVTLAAGRGEESSRRIVVVASGAFLVAGCAAVLAHRRRRFAGSEDGPLDEDERLVDG